MTSSTPWASTLNRTPSTDIAPKSLENKTTTPTTTKASLANLPNGTTSSGGAKATAPTGAGANGPGAAASGSGAAAVANGVASNGTKLPARVDVEQIYISLREGLGDNWAIYSDAIRNYFRGSTNRAELAQQIDPLISKPELQRLHNQYFLAVEVNATREPPESDVATWVSHQGKANLLPKPVTGDAYERRLKKEVMSLPARDRRRMKEIPDADEELQSTLQRQHLAKQLKHHNQNDPSHVPMSAGLNKNWQTELTTAYSAPLASESGEYMDTESILARCVPICYDEGLGNAMTDETAKFVGLATDMFVREILGTLLGRIRLDPEMRILKDGDGNDGGHTSYDSTRQRRGMLGNGNGSGGGGGIGQARQHRGKNNSSNSTSLVPAGHSMLRNSVAGATLTTTKARNKSYNNNTHNYNNKAAINLADKRGGTISMEHLRLSVGFSDNLIRQMPLSVHQILGGINAYDRFEELDEDYWEEQEKREEMGSRGVKRIKMEANAAALLLAAQKRDDDGRGTDEDEVDVYRQGYVKEEWENPASVFLMECLSGH